MPIGAWVLASAVVVGAAASIAGQTLSPEDSLKATHETLMQAVAAANVDRVAAIVHPKGLGFFRASQQVAELQGSANFASLVQGLLKDLGEFTASQVSLSTTIRVVGDTGIVTQTSIRDSIVNKKKVERHLRTTGVYVRTTDGWKLMSWHTSDTPLEK
jgi:ketosteroid isomerase-like protein